MIFGESLIKTAYWTSANTVEVGFLSESILLSPSFKGKGHALIIPQELYKPLQSTIGLVKEADYPDFAKKFQELILSERGKEIFKKYGYEF